MSKEGVQIDAHEPDELAKTIAGLELRNRELEEESARKDAELKRLFLRCAELEKELKRKDLLRMSQLELLALRNVELEKELSRSSSCGSFSE